MQKGRGYAVAAGAACGLALLLGPTCTQFDEGITVEVEVLHHFGQTDEEIPPVISREEPRAFTTDLGYQIELTRGYLAIAEVQLVECEEDSQVIRRDRPAGTLWGDGVARAHTITGDPTVLGVPYVEDVLSPDLVAARIGTLRPPPGRYCEARILIGPADRDAVALPDAVDMVGLSLYLEGTYRADPDDQPIPFRIASSDSHEALVPLLDAFQGDPQPLVLDDDQRDARLPLGLFTNLWLDGIDFAATGEPVWAHLAVADAAATLHHHPGL